MTPLPGPSRTPHAPPLPDADGDPWRDVAATLARVAPLDLPVLCLRCHGAAFDRAARRIHRASGRHELIAVDLRRGQAAAADLLRAAGAERATLAVDGIERLDADAQAWLAIALDGRCLRLVAGTALELDALRARCRPELFAALATIALRTPALCELGDDLGRVATARVQLAAVALGRPTPALSPAALAALAAHPWPGDLAELDALLQRTLFASSADPLSSTDLVWQPELRDPPPRPAESARSGVTESAHAQEDAAAAPPEPCAGGADPSDDATKAVSSDAAAPEPALDGRGTAAGGLAIAPPSEAIALELAHQIKNPLVVVKAFVRSVGELVDPPPDLAPLCEQTEEAVRRMDAAIEELLAFSRLGPPRPAAIDAVEALREALREAWPEFAAKDVAVSGPNGATLRVVADEEHVRQALATLARHLLESIEARGTIAVSVDPAGELRLRYREAGAATHLRGLAGLDRQELPLAVLLARGALAAAGATLAVHEDDGMVEVALRFATG